VSVNILLTYFLSQSLMNLIIEIASVTFQTHCKPVVMHVRRDFFRIIEETADYLPTLFKFLCVRQGIRFPTNATFNL